jgi:YD repeat-containing protein
LASVTDPLGRVTRARVDRFGNSIETIDALGEVTLITRDTLGQATFTQLPTGHDYSDTYSGYLHTKHVDNWTDESRYYHYTTYNRLSWDSGGAAQHFYAYNATGGEGPAGTLQYEMLGSEADTLAHHFPNALGKDTALVDNLHNRTRWVYATPAAGGNLQQAYDPLGRVTSMLYNGYGLDSMVITQFHGVYDTTRTYDDVMSRPDTVIDANGHVTVTTYGPGGVTAIKTPNGDLYRFDVNGWGLVVARHDLGDTALVDSLGYDAAGQLRRHVLRDGEVVTMSYDALGRDSTMSADRGSTGPTEALPRRATPMPPTPWPMTQRGGPSTSSSICPTARPTRCPWRMTPTAS